MQENRFADAIDLCDQVIVETATAKPDLTQPSVMGRLKLTESLHERFSVIRNVRLVNCLQNTMSTIFKRQSNFDT